MAPTTPVAPIDWKSAKTLPAATFPIIDWIPAAIDPAATPPLVKPKIERPGPNAPATTPTIAMMGKRKNIVEVAEVSNELVNVCGS